MQLTLHLPGDSLAVDQALAEAGVGLGVQQLHGQLSAAPIPAHAANPCDAEGCTYLGKVVVEGLTWLMYLCPDGTLEYYLA